MKKQWYSILLALVLALSLLPTASLAEEALLPDVTAELGEPPEEDWLEPEDISASPFDAGKSALSGEAARSGALNREFLTRQKIRELLSAAPLDGSSSYYQPAGAFAEAPSLSEPYSPGRVSDSALQGALNRLNALRTLAGLPTVALDADLNENAQYGALAMAYLGTITHDPAEGATADAFAALPEDIRTSAAEAARTSNLYAGVNLTWAADGFMDDSDQSNIARLGHRRWQLNPNMWKVGFGYAISNTRYRQYVVEKVFDTSCWGEVDYDFAWHASGNFPNNLSAFERTSAWSVTLNPAKYRTPNLNTVKVTLTGGGNTWTLYSGSADGYFNIDTGGYGVSNCIIFLPGGSTAKFEGDYTVDITGLQDKSGADTSLRYTVSFFDASAAPSPTHRLRVTNGHAVGLAPQTSGEEYEVEEGESVILTAEALLPDTVFRDWSSDNDVAFRNLGTGTVSFTMPDQDTEITANFVWQQDTDALRFAARYDESGRLIQVASCRTGGEAVFDSMTLVNGDKIFILDPETMSPLCSPILSVLSEPHR